MKNAQEVLLADLNYICDNLKSEFSQIAGKRLLIVGGAGFLGYYLVQSVTHWNKVYGQKKIYLTVYDNFIRGYPDWLMQLQAGSDINLRKQDITQPLPSDIEDFQYIIHAASIASPSFYRKFPIETMDANVNGLRSLLEYCRHQQSTGKFIDGFLFFSTSEIYGDPDTKNIPTSEEYRGNVSCTGPRSCYDESKRYGETLCINFSQQYDLPIKIARPFNNYGPGLKISDRRVLSDFAHEIFFGRDIVLLSDGSPTRTFCYVADAVVGYYKILTIGKPGMAYNIGTEEPEVSIACLAEKVCQIAKNKFCYEGQVVYKASDDKNYLVDNPNRRCPTITRARTGLGYDPRISLDEGLYRSLIWYRDNQWGEDV